MRTALGLDVSLSRTGVFVGAAAPGGQKMVQLHRESIVLDKNDYDNDMLRSAAIADKVGGVLATYKPTIVVIEGYSLGSKFQLASLVQVGTMVRWVVLVKKGHYIDVAPSSLKKFVLLKGQGEKDKMMMEIFARWGIKAENNDEGDAAALAAVGLADMGELQVPKAGREVLGTAKHYYFRKKPVPGT